MKRKILVLMLLLVVAGCGSGGDSGGNGGGSAAPAAIAEANNKAAYDKALYHLTIFTAVGSLLRHLPVHRHVFPYLVR